MDDKTVAAVDAVLPDYSTDQVREVLGALAQIQSDPEVGMVLRDPASGAVALRVSEYGQVYWRVVDLRDKSWIETEPLVGWDVLHEAVAVVTTPGEAAVDPVEEAPPAK
jgi:hypothetical protein